MRLHTFKHNPSELLKEGLQLVGSSSDYKFIHRVVMVNLMLSGNISSLRLSQLSGIAQRTLNQWLNTVDEYGFERLRAIKQDGRPRKLTDNQLTEIKDAISNNPEKNGFNVWEGPALSAFIKSKYGIELGVRQCQRLFRQLGFSLIRPQPYPSIGETNEKKRDTLKKTKKYSKNSRRCFSFPR